jgi:putative membrane protein
MGRIVVICNQRNEEVIEMMRFGWDPSSFMFDGGIWWMGAIFLALRLVVLAIIILIVYKLFKQQSNKARPIETMKVEENKTKNSEDDALRILRERYAKGEIDTEEYQHRKSELQS